MTSNTGGHKQSANVCFLKTINSQKINKQLIINLLKTKNLLKIFKRLPAMIKIYLCI